MADTINFDSTALLLDIDGTILDFAERPERVSVPAELRHCLSTLWERLNGALAFVSGSTIADVDRLFTPLRFASAGVHGAELRVSPEAPVGIVQQESLPAGLWKKLAITVATFPDVFVEDKTFAYAVHYSNARQLKEPLSAALQSIATDMHDPTLTLMFGHNVIEFKRRVHEKGMAIAQLMRQPAFAGRTPVFIGDDTTDLPGFAMALRLGGRAYSVGRQIEGLTGAFDAPSDVRAWLRSAARTSEAVQ